MSKSNEQPKSAKRKPFNRFDVYDPKAPYSEPKSVGLINNDNDYKLGCPTLKRHQNVTILASSTTRKDSLLLNFKWRPCKSSSGLVCLTTKFQLSLEKETICYEHEEQIIYQPNKSQVRSNYITQFDSSQSSLKLFISAPYRRLRATFRGQVKSNISPDKTIFVKANFIITSSSGIFDFKDEFRPKDELVQKAIDKHEQLVQVKGEYLLVGENSKNEEKLKGTFLGWGLYLRQFVYITNDPILSKQILIYMALGRVYHFECLTYKNRAFEYKAACLDHDNSMEQFNQPYVVDWSQIGNNNKEFDLYIVNNDKNLHAKASRKATGDFFEIEMDGQLGWAWISENEAFETDEDLLGLKKCFDKYRDNLQAGKFAKSLKYNSKERPLVVSLEDTYCASSDLVGSKASSLAQLDLFSKISKIEYKVPHAFVLTRFVYEAILEENESVKEAIQKLETDIGNGKLDHLQLECEKLERLLSEATLPEVVQQELGAILRLYYGEEKDLEKVKFAVRSSSWGEDEEDMSAAGQLSTILGVRGFKQIMKAVMSCFASKFTYANVEYKRQHGLGLNLPMAVVVQELIDCEKAGVLFTCDPTTGNDSVVMITANYGLGESVVSGKADPDSIRLQVRHLPGGEKDVQVQNIQIGQKQVMIDGESTSDEMSSLVSNKYDRSKCCLEQEEMLKLAQCGLELANHFQSPRDIEWGFMGGSLYLFQSRPITGLDNYTEFELLHEGDLTSRRELEFLIRANIGEVKPFAITPLSLSYADRFWCLMESQSKIDKRYVTEAHRGLFVDSYHCFLSLYDGFFAHTNSRDGEKTIKTRTMEYGVFGHEINYPEVDKILNLLEKRVINHEEVFLLFLKEFMASPVEVVAKHRRTVEEARVDVANCKFATGYECDRLTGLLRQVEKVVDFGKIAVSNHGCTIILGNEHNSQLTEMLAKYISDPVKVFACLAKILASSPGVVSAEIPKRINSLAKIIVDTYSSLEVDKFISMPPREALQFIKANQGELVEEFNSFIERFGHRCYNEFEISTRRWREQPEDIAEMIQRNCSAITKGDGTRGEKQEMDIDRVVESLEVDMSPEDEHLLKTELIPKCQLYVGLREQTKDVFISHSDLMRRATQMLAKELCKNLRLPDEELLYYLFYDELEPLVREPQPSIVVQATRRRNIFRKNFTETWKFDEIIYGYDIMPIHKRPSVELNEALAKAPKLYGTPASSGRVQARVCLVTSYNQVKKVRSGDILVAHSTDIGYSPVFPLLSGIITEVGGLISHGAVVAREYGLPSVLGVAEVTRILKDGDEIILDADNGVIIRL